jgi:hypothetical protein
MKRVAGRDGLSNERVVSKAAEVMTVSAHV